MIIGTHIVPAVLKPSRKRREIDGKIGYYEKFFIEPSTLLLTRGFPTEKLTEFSARLRRLLPPEEESHLLETGGFSPFLL